jgi:type II secretory pathway pseudopilin PulG
MLKTRFKSLLFSQVGFSILEVVLSVVLVSVGLVAVSQTSLFSLSTLNYANVRFEANRAAEEKIWEVQNQALRWGQRPPATEEGQLLGTERIFAYHLQSVPLQGSSFLFEVRLSVQWLSSGKRNTLNRDFYARLPVSA